MPDARYVDTGYWDIGYAEGDAAADAVPLDPRFIAVAPVRDYTVTVDDQGHVQ